MKKINLKKLALIGMGGILITQAQQADAGQQNSWGNQQYIADAMENTSKMSESELLQKLTPEAKATYQGLSKEGKELALKLANQSCHNKNDCKGQNSCRTSENDCAGQGGCKAQSKGPFADKNMAVMVAAKAMAEKRLKAMVK